ncbi:hypothetical protein ABE82_26375 (plasmid) [Paenibacillus peoriae]|uniref:hypothetical protein n=1 Tax=Paenibacillus peoriae TaxID=59893 RepID=UPI00071F5ED1|nr:hypothetical protein [Paenibacillus peoriae]ALS09944.1 hypothetical protein ABE82_26375 [Paenibacillus peoriae]
MGEVKDKFDEAQFFYGHMVQSCNEDSVTEFRYYLSAFLSAARSVQLYVETKAKSTKRLKDHNKLVGNNPILGYFREKRNMSIHCTKVPTKQKIEIQMRASMALSIQSSIEITKYDRDGKLIEVLRREPLKKSSGPKDNSGDISSTQTFSIYFNDRKEADDDEDVLTLGQRYIDELQRFIAEAEQFGLINE